jgi:hypothetical protein
LLEVWKEEGYKDLKEFLDHEGRYDVDKKHFRN